MAFFKFRKAPANEPARTPLPPESIDALRQRAKYRLVGASVLVLLGVIGFPLLFDKQPRPIAVDTPIEIPDRNKVAPLVLPPAPQKSSSERLVTTPAPSTTTSPASAATLAPLPAPKLEADKKVAAGLDEKAKDAAKVPVSGPVKSASVAAPDIKVAAAATKPASAAAKPASAPTKATADTAPAKASVASDAGKAQSALEDKPAADAGRFVVQVGAFAEASRAHEVRMTLEKAGLKTYTHVAETKDGKRIRVRVGPFASKAEAQTAAKKVKELKLPAALLTL